MKVCQLQNSNGECVFFGKCGGQLNIETGEFYCETLVKFIISMQAVAIATCANSFINEYKDKIKVNK